MPKSSFEVSQPDYGSQPKRDANKKKWLTPFLWGLLILLLVAAIVIPIVMYSDFSFLVFPYLTIVINYVLYNISNQVYIQPRLIMATESPVSRLSVNSDFIVCVFFFLRI